MAWPKVGKGQNHPRAGAVKTGVMNPAYGIRGGQGVTAMPAKKMLGKPNLPPGYDVSKLTRINIGKPLKKVVTPVAKPVAKKKKGLTGVDMQKMLTSQTMANAKPGTYNNTNVKFPNGTNYGAVTVTKSADGKTTSVGNWGSSSNAGGATKGGFGKK